MRTDMKRHDEEPAVARASDEDWRERALCAEVDPELWFPEPGCDSPAAKLICGRCPVQVECLDFAMTNYEPYGIWGGLSAHERRELRAEVRAVAALGRVA
jgi:WhiB family redox-sensing transcriptional regulator